MSDAKSANRFRGNCFYMSDRDTEIMHFLWRWKIASTASVYEAVVKPGSAYSAYKALERLARHDLVEATSSKQYRFTAWHLTDLGFNTIRESLGELTEEGYLSENWWHDRNVLAFHLGEWSKYKFSNVQFFTEQELRRRSVEYYPPWVPQINDHRSDGYTLIESDRKQWVLAYEIELTAKSVARYESIIRFYKMIRNVDRVYWLVGNQKVKDQILTAKACSKDDSPNYHLFVDLKDYLKLGWDAHIKNDRSDNLFTIRENIRGLIGDPYGKYIGDIQGTAMFNVHYDPNKVLGKSRPSRT